MYGYEKSSKMQDKILSRMDRKEEVTRYDLPQRSWTPERWAHRLNTKAEAPKPLDLNTFAKTFNSK